MAVHNDERRIFAQDIDDADMRWQFGAASLRLRCSPNRESGCEDAIAVIPVADRGVVLAVADGVGGSPGGREAAQIVLEFLRLGVASARPGELPAAIHASIEAANMRLIEQGRGSGTTVAVAQITEDTLYSYHVGDSEVLVVGQRGKVKHRIVPHSPTGFAVESGLLTEEQAMFHEYRHILLNVVGAPNMRVDTAEPLPLAARDTVVLASDGLLDNLYPAEIMDEARCGELPGSADRLVEFAQRRMHNPELRMPSKPDDLSVILYRRNAA